MMRIACNATIYITLRKFNTATQQRKVQANITDKKLK